MEKGPGLSQLLLKQMVDRRYLIPQNLSVGIHSDAWHHKIPITVEPLENIVHQLHLRLSYVRHKINGESVDFSSFMRHASLFGILLPHQLPSVVKFFSIYVCIYVIENGILLEEPGYIYLTLSIKMHKKLLEAGVIHP